MKYEEIQKLLNTSDDDTRKITVTVGQIRDLVKDAAMKLQEKQDAECEHDIVTEMSNKYQKETGLPVNIWIDENAAYVNEKHSKRIKFQLDTSTSNKPNEVASMDFEGNVYVPKGKKLRLQTTCIAQVNNFVQNNKAALESLADMKIKMVDIWPFMIMGGEGASRKQILELNAKVAELEVEEKKAVEREKEKAKKYSRRKR